MIQTKDQLEKAALRYGLLPFFSNRIPGFSVEEMAAPGMLFGGNAGEDGCWEWKGPVIQNQTTAYGKFFNRKAGFVSLDLFPDFLNYRRAAYPVAEGSVEQMLLHMVSSREGMTSSGLRRLVAGESATRLRRQALEAPLQRLQMGGWLLIADFEYKFTVTGDRYGWGVALYSTPEIWFERQFDPLAGRSPRESLDFLVDRLSRRLPSAPRKDIEKLLK